MARVIHIISGLSVGGAETVLLRLTTASRGRVCSHSVISLTCGGEMRERFAAAGTEVTEFDFKKAPISEFLRLVKLLRKTRPTIVQTWMYHADLLGGVAARLAGVRNVIWGVRTTDATAGGSKTIAILQWASARFSAVIPRAIVCAAEASRSAHADVGYDGRRMIVVPNGFDFARLCADESQREALRAQCGFQKEDVVVGTLGRFNRAKDPENFVRAAGLLAKDRPEVRFLMVGREMTGDNAELRAWIAETGHPERFVLLGERADAAICLAAMDIYCLSSRTEGFPNALAEAMAMRLACVTTDVGDAAMLMGGIGAVVPREDAQALAAALADVASMSTAERHRWGQLASERVRTEFSLEQMRERFEAIYNELIENKEGGH